jgi:hypothetical protein
MEGRGHTYKLYFSNYYLDVSFEYGDGGIFKLLSWVQNLHQPTWGHEILCSDLQSMSNFNNITFAKNEKCQRCGRLKF